MLGIDPYPRKPGAVFAAAGGRRRCRASVRGAGGAEKEAAKRQRRTRCIVRPPHAVVLRSARLRRPDALLSRHAPERSALRSTPWGVTMGAAVVVPGAELSLARHPDIEFLLFGDRAADRAAARRPSALKAASPLVHTDVAIQMDDKPSQALRKGRWKSSMWLAIDAVKKGEADVAVSAGNTGALMAMAKIRSADHGRASSGRRSRRSGRRCKGEFDRARSRRLDRRRRRASGRSRGDGQRHGARAVRSSGRPSACSISAWRRSRGSRRCARPARSCARANGRNSTMSASSRATISARARSTWW